MVLTSVFTARFEIIKDDESGLHANYEDLLETLVPHEPISRYRHYRIGEAVCPGRTGPATRP